MGLSVMEKCKWDLRTNLANILIWSIYQIGVFVSVAATRFCFSQFFSEVSTCINLDDIPSIKLHELGMSYKVSILVPVYGVEQYIERCTRSLFEQDYDNLEYIFVDDYTPDNSIELLEKTLCDYPKRKEQVRIIRHEKNRGLGAARNTAVQNASGMFLMHCDSDDWMGTQAVSLLVEKQIDTNADIVSGKSCRVYDDHMETMEESKYKNKEEFLLQMLKVKKTSSHVMWNRLIRASLYHDYQIEVREGVNFNEDLQVFPKLVYFAKKVARIEEVTYYYNCTNAMSYCQQLETNKDLWEQCLMSYEIIRDFFEDKEKAFYRAVSERTINNYWGFAHRAAKHGDRAFFEKYKAAINEKYADYQYVLGYQNPFKKWFQQQYWVYGAFLRTRSAVYGLVKNKERSLR